MSLHLRYKIPIIVTIILIGIPLSFFFILVPLENYYSKIQYESSNPKIELIGVVIEENKYGFKYKLLVDDKQFEFESVFLEFERSSPELIGKKVMVGGFFDNNYQNYLLRQGFEFEKDEIIPVIFVKQIEFI